MSEPTWVKPDDVPLPRRGRHGLHDLEEAIAMVKQEPGQWLRLDGWRSRPAAAAQATKVRKMDPNLDARVGEFGKGWSLFLCWVDTT